MLENKEDIKNYILTTHHQELPDHLQEVFKKIMKLEKLTIFYLITVIIAMYMSTGNSQAMKMAWIEDLMSMIPSLAFIIGGKVLYRKPNKQFPYGYHRVYSLAFLTGSVALFGIGLYMSIDSLINLFNLTHPTIGSFNISGHQFWQGWLMLIVLLYSSIPAVILGHIKHGPARKLHNKLLFTDAITQKADWQTAAAAMVGVIGIGFGLWWVDTITALFISISVIHDGVKQIKIAVSDLMDRFPRTIEKDELDPLSNELKNLFLQLGWVKDVRIRLRECGMVYFGDVYVLPLGDENLTDNIENAYRQARKISWKLHDIVITPVRKFPD